VPAEPMMTVSGIRGVVNETLTPRLCSLIAYLQTRNAHATAMIIARDTRPSGAALARAVARGIHAAGARCIDIGIAPTPTACVAVAEKNAGGGVILTASHNPAQYNGYKMINRQARLCPGAECEAVYALYRAGSREDACRAIDAASEEPDQTYDAGPAHIRRIVAGIDAKAVRAARLRIAVDAINGAASAVVPALLDTLQVSCTAINAGANGDFVHNPEPRTEHLAGLASVLKRGDFNGGFAFDPDADRLITMGEHGEPVSEELTLAFALQCMLPRLKTDIAVNLSTSMVIDDVAASFGVRVFRTMIGEANVIDGMLRNNCRMGGEGNGGVIYPEISTVRDGLAGLAMVLELMAVQKKPVSALAAGLPAYVIVKEKIDTAGADPRAIIARAAAAFAHEKTDIQDGLKIIRPGAWVHLRPSNTEPIVRCIAEARTRPEADSLIRAVMSAIR